MHLGIENVNIFEGISKIFFPAFPYVSMVLDPPRKVLISDNIDTFACDAGQYMIMTSLDLVTHSCADSLSI